ncbi:AAA domain-containing protein [Stackebrandtia albiflava]|uniref:AAA domain-containing protein n=1 Tax=Stackebrandtia albiflava TaxID=406432 RepID=A0A562UXZ6_9ACTN|nr:AAA domain-containing protein [Stackebrandtia albiflava]TWJ10482.1 AAA domain-containing protein [Stackebrandtia albiflava]
MDVSRLFLALADLAPKGRNGLTGAVPERTPFSWHIGLFSPLQGMEASRLASLDELHRHERLLRHGWGVVVGDTTVDGRRRPVMLPLVTRPVRLRRIGHRYRVEEAGDVTVHPSVTDQATVDTLEAVFHSPAGAPGGDALLTAARATGLPVARVADGPVEDALVVVPHAIVFLARHADRVGVADDLRRWATVPGVAETALGAVHRTAATEQATEPGTDSEPWSPLPLNTDQRLALLRARNGPVTVVSGAPGCGKSHLLAAVALDAIDAGRSVLLATQSVHAADVLAGLLARQPGPTPVLFGDSEKRAAFLTELSGGLATGFTAEEVRVHELRAEAAQRHVRTIEAELREALRQESLASRVRPADTLLLNDFPRLRDTGTDLSRVFRHLAAAEAGEGWRARWGRWRLRRLAGDRPLPEVRAAATVAEHHHAAARLAAGSGTDLTGRWTDLHEAEELARHAIGDRLRHRAGAASRRDGGAARALTALTAAMRAGRSRRRGMLTEIDPVDLLRALPLWIGTVSDVEDVLPAIPGMFDLVIMDEASHIDQLRAAPVLVRAKTAVVAGDPRQLRFVSFVSDAEVDVVAARHGLTGDRDRLDVRRSSAFDLAASTAATVRLTEHHRSVPHLIDFPARRFYQGRVAPVTRHPRNDDVDAIDVHRVTAEAPEESGAVPAEVDETLRLVDEAVQAGEEDIAVITPFRAQADAVERHLLARYPETISRRLLRIGTVHAFQGSEADTVVVSLGVTDGCSAGRKRFAASPNLFNVMVTRARRRLHVVTSLTAPDGLIGDFLAHAERPLPPPEATEPGEWVRELAVELRRAGVAVTEGYPVGHWTVDLCAGRGEDAVGLICAVHPDGVDAHLARQRSLHRAGWRLGDAFASRYRSDPTRAALDLLTRYGLTAS